MGFSISANPAQPGPQQVNRHLVVEQVLAVQRQHRDPHPVAAGQLGVAVDVHQLQPERLGRLLLAQDPLGLLAQVAAGPGVEGDRPAHGPEATAGRAGAEARRNPRYITLAPRARPRASWSLEARNANTPPPAASSTPRAMSRLPSNRGRRSRRPRRARPLATAPPTTMRVPTVLPITARARTATGRNSLPSGTSRPATSAGVTF